LTFNPKKRFTVEMALSSEYLSPYHDPEDEPEADVLRRLIWGTWATLGAELTFLSRDTAAEFFSFDKEQLNREQLKRELARVACSLPG
jgi:hypothetical protein